MSDIVITGASRGIGRALARAVAAARPADRLILVARDRDRLAEVAGEVGPRALAVPGDLGSLASARALGGRLADVVSPGATLVHNAGLWPATRELDADGLEASFVVNHLGPLAMQQPLLEGGRLSRILVVSAGLIAFGRFDGARTPRGEDFSSLRTYCTTKLCFALAMRDVGAAHREIDVLCNHPGVVRTDLGARRGLIGWLLQRTKLALERPETTADRLVRILGRERWSPPGDVRWMIEEEERPWPKVAEDEAVRRAVRDTTRDLLDLDPGPDQARGIGDVGDVVDVVAATDVAVGRVR